MGKGDTLEGTTALEGSPGLRVKRTNPVEKDRKFREAQISLRLIGNHILMNMEELEIVPTEREIAQLSSVNPELVSWEQAGFNKKHAEILERIRNVYYASQLYAWALYCIEAGQPEKVESTMKDIQNQIPPDIDYGEMGFNDGHQALLSEKRYFPGL